MINDTSASSENEQDDENHTSCDDAQNKKTAEVLLQDIPTNYDSEYYEGQCQDDSNSDRAGTRVQLKSDSNGDGDRGGYVTAVFAHISEDQDGSIRVGDNNSQGDDDDEYCWEEVSFRAEGRDCNDINKELNEEEIFPKKEGKESSFLQAATGWLKRSPKSSDDSHQTMMLEASDADLSSDCNDKDINAEEMLSKKEGKQESRFLQTAAGWLKRGPKLSDDSNNQTILEASDAGMNSAVLPFEHTVEELKDMNESGTHRSRLSSVRRWWTAAGSHDDESQLKGQVVEPAPAVYAASTSHSSDAGSVKSDSEDSSIDLKVSALDWLQGNDNVVAEEQVAEDEESVSSSGLESFGSGYGSEGNFLNETVSSTRTSKQRSRDLKKVVQWMRKGKGKGRRREDEYDPSGEYRKLDSMLPKSKKKGATPKDRAHEIEGALDWLRSRQDISAIDESTQSAIDFGKFGPAPICVTSPEDRQQELHNVMNWVRNKGQGLKKEYDPNGNFRKLDKLLPKKRQVPMDRAREIEGFMDWMRNSAMLPIGATNLPEFENIESFHVSLRTPEQRAKDLEHVMLWMCQEEGDFDDTADPTGDFSKLNLILEVKERQSSNVRAREIECALDWFRNNQLETDSLPSADSRPRRKAGSVSRNRGSPQWRRRTPSPMQKQNPEAPIPKLIGFPLVEEGPDWFASSGRIVNVVVPPSDVSTIANEDQKDVLLGIAPSNEIANAIA